jgi:hypothetical protein
MLVDAIFVSQNWSVSASFNHFNQLVHAQKNQFVCVYASNIVACYGSNHQKRLAILFNIFTLNPHLTIHTNYAHEIGLPTNTYLLQKRENAPLSADAVIRQAPSYTSVLGFMFLVHMENFFKKYHMSISQSNLCEESLCAIVSHHHQAYHLLQFALLTQDCSFDVYSTDLAYVEFYLSLNTYEAMMIVAYFDSLEKGSARLQTFNTHPERVEIVVKGKVLLSAEYTEALTRVMLDMDQQQREKYWLLDQKIEKTALQCANDISTILKTCPAQLDALLTELLNGLGQSKLNLATLNPIIAALRQHIPYSPRTLFVGSKQPYQIEIDAVLSHSEALIALNTTYGQPQQSVLQPAAGSGALLP